MTKILPWVVLLAAAGCGSSTSDTNGTGGNSGTGGTAGNGGSQPAECESNEQCDPGEVCDLSTGLCMAETGGTGGGNGGDTQLCERICESPCVSDVVDPGEIATCVEDCTIGGTPLDGCLPETAAVLDCVEQFSCEGGLECAAEFTTLAGCVEP